MKGNIYYIEGNCGRINGEDNAVYFFHKNDLLNCTIYQLSEGDYVEFEVEKQSNFKNDKAVKIRKKGADISNSKNTVNPGINPKFKFDNFNNDEKEILNYLKKVFYLTNSGSPLTIANSTYRYCLVKPTNDFSLTFNLNREIVIIFSDYVSFEPRTLDAATYAIEQISSKLRIDRGCQIVISSDEKIEQKLSAILKDTNLNSIVIPFSYKELLSSPNEGFVLNRFRKYLFDVDLFSSSNPIQNDIFFFGRRDYVFDIVNKCKNNIHSGIFGLRRSGKTSLLYAIKRLLKNDNYPAIYIPCQSQLSSSNWQMALYTIIRDIYKETGIKERNVHSKQSYLDGNAAVCFEDDILTLYKETSKTIVLLFDEIEAITFDVPSDNSNWADGTYYISFWNALRGLYLKNPNVISIVVAGTNPRINEIPVLHNGSTNPMYGQLALSNQGAYLLPFTLIDTQNMVNTLGGYMGLSFDDHVCSSLTLDCGGHPYLIRLLCSFINHEIKDAGLSRPRIVSQSKYNEFIKLFEETNEATGFYLMILNILVTNYPKEFNVLKELALNGGKYISNFVDDNALLHLLGYGLIENVDGIYKIRFKTIERYLLGKYKYERANLTIEEQKQEIQYRINSVEMSLRKLVKNTLATLKGINKSKELVLKVMTEHSAIQSYDLTKANSLSYNELFDPSVNKIYFSVLSRIIVDNFDLFANIFENTSKDDLRNDFDIINKARRVPDHSYTESSQNWTQSDFLQFRHSISKIEELLKNYE